MADELVYQDKILAHAKAPRHYGESPNATVRRTGVNPLCGDEVTLFYTPLGSVQTLQFISKGCALCRASASLMLTAAEGRPQQEWGALAWDPALQELAASFPSRTRCIELPWETFAQLQHDLTKEKL